MTKVNLEWDETSQCMRLRRGLVQVDGAMQVLVAWIQSLSTVRSI